MKTILILDDAATLQTIADVLRSQNYRVLEASCGLQALELARREGPISLLVTDMKLPDTSGIDIALNLVAWHPELPVLIMSNNPKDWWANSNVSNFSRFPPNNLDFMAKPFSASELMMRVRNLIGQNHIDGVSQALFSQRGVGM